MPKAIQYFRPKWDQSPARSYETAEDRLADKRFYSLARWRRLRAMKLRANPVCEVCELLDEVTPAQQVHHKRERKKHPHLEFDWDNLESVCIPCHNAKRSKSSLRD